MSSTLKYSAATRASESLGHNRRVIRADRRDNAPCRFENPFSAQGSSLAIRIRIRLADDLADSLESLLNLGLIHIFMGH